MKLHDVEKAGANRLISPPKPCTPAHLAQAEAVDLAIRFRDHIENRGFPCVGAKSALGRNQMTAYVGRDLTSAWDDVALADSLVKFAHNYNENYPLFTTFAAFFPSSPRMCEEGFEAALWERIASLQAKDDWLGQRYDTAVSPNPESPNFSLSFGGRSFFVVGMHPNASRPARRFDVPVLVFNLHDQFERLRADGRYEKLRETILKRDEKIAGSINPMLARHGEASEARQYSGRIVSDDWECPWPGRSVNA